MINNTFENIQMISQPKEIQVPLYQHQLASIYQMEKREHEQRVENGNTIVETNISVNADTTGYGKTLAMITLVYRDKMKWDLSTPYQQSTITTYASGRIKKTTTNEYDKIDVTLVLASQSIIHQWYDECQRTPLSVKMITSKQLVDTVMIENYDVILVTPTMYNKLISKYNQIAWKRFIFDEPGHLKIPAMNKIIAGFIWLVTATPDAIIAQHKNCRHSFMQDLICFAGWGPFTIHFDYMIIKNSDEFIQQSFSMPPTNQIYHKCYNPIYKAINGFVTENISQMISAGNIQGAIKALGGGETQNIAELVKQKKIAELEELESRLTIYKIKNKKKQIESLTIKIERLNAQLKELTNRYEIILKGDCSICFSSITNPVMEPNCQNIFCGQCLLTWFNTKNTCPLCRDNVQTKELIYINTNETNQKSHKNSEPPQPQTKNNKIISLLKENSNRKFIIFSSWDETFTPIRTHLEQNNISFIEVKGGVEERKKNIDSFKDGDTQVIFLNSRFNGAGINLQEASDIIVYHEMENSTLNQIIGRANRIGRTKSLNVHHLQI
jgi:SNF2 family DNA or RNA helicase